eukprot:1162094-Pelagomonas_calceolata.AAC.1
MRHTGVEATAYLQLCVLLGLQHERGIEGHVLRLSGPSQPASCCAQDGLTGEHLHALLAGCVAHLQHGNVTDNTHHDLRMDLLVSTCMPLKNTLQDAKIAPSDTPHDISDLVEARVTLFMYPHDLKEAPSDTPRDLHMLKAGYMNHLRQDMHMWGMKRRPPTAYEQEHMKQRPGGSTVVQHGEAETRQEAQC